MTEKKNQHYVPKLYLRLFSVNNDNSQIGLFYLNKEFYKQKVPLKHQAKEDYFYGEDGLLEEELSELEDQAAPCLKEIILTSTLPKNASDNYLKVFTFSMILANRTKDVAEQVKETTDKVVREIMKYDERMKDKVDKYRIYPTNPAAIAISATGKQLHLAMDLKCKLLINKTQLKFITSDHPVIKYNQYLEQRKHPGGNVGLATKGLQMFFPISPDYMLCFYDDWVYKIGGKSQDVLDITCSEDVDKLNYLQVLNCLDHLYFNQSISEYYIRTLYARAKSKRLTEYSALQKSYSYTDKEGLEHIGYHTYGHNIEIKLELSFINQTKKAKRHILSDYVVQLRNENLRSQRT